MVRKNYNHCFSFCEIFWVKLKAFFCSALQVEGIWNTSNILTTEKKKKSKSIILYRHLIAKGLFSKLLPL